MGWKSKAYLSIILAAGLSSLAVYMPQLRPADPARFAAFFTLALLSSGLKIRLPGIESTISVLFLFVLIGIVELSLPEALVTVVAACFVQSFWRPRNKPKAVQVVFNIASLVIATVSAEFAYHGAVLVVADAPIALRLALAATAFFVGNTLTVAVIVALTGNKPVVETWRSGYFWAFPYYFVGACIVGLFAYLTRVAAWQTSILILPVMYLVYRSCRLYLDRLEEGRLHAQQLQSAADRLNSVLESTTDSVFVVGSDSKVTYANQRARAGVFKEADPVGLSAWDRFPSLEVDSFVEQMTAELKANRAFNAERFFPELNAWFELHAYPSPEGAVLYLKDVTEQRALREQLRQAQKMEAVGQLAGGVAHDFNNLLTVILGYGGVVAESVKNGDEFTHMSIQEVLKAGHRASALTQRLLAFSRKQILQPEILNPNEVVTGMEGMLKRIIGEDVEIRVQLDRGVGLVLADCHQLEQVVMNLCVNARDAMPGGGQLTISTSDLMVEAVRPGLPVRAPGRHVVLSVTDTGSGMDAETQARIFEPFFTTKGAGKGTGLGLSMVYGIVEQSGGSLRVESALGKGSTFEIYLPCADSADRAETLDETPADLTGKECVLLVEDEAAVRQLTERMLMQAGYRVISVESGEEALNLPESVLPTVDLVVTDVVLPGMNGPDLAEALMKKWPDIRVLYVSGYADHPLLAEGELPDNAALLQKPFKREGLLSKVRSCLGEPSPTSSAQC